MRVSIIITTYNWKSALKVSLKSIYNQSLLPNEIIIADDGSSDGTDTLIQDIAQTSTIPLIHSWQEDDGFRASSSRNKAIAKATSEYIILIDGDMILHKDFIKDHIKIAKQGYFVQGGRVLITQAKTPQVLQDEIIEFGFFDSGIKNRKNTIHSNILSSIFSVQKDTLKGIRTCNMAFFRDDCIKVNGFNEDFVGWGREDSEFAVRLINSGIKRQTIKFCCIAYHIHHNENSKKMLEINDKILQNSIDNKLIFCQNGIDKYLKDI